MKTYTFPLLLATAYLALALGYSAIVPIYEAPDEPGHFHLIVHLHNNHSLPVQSFEYPTYAHHPPLFYVLAALISAPADIRDNAGLPQFRDHVDWNWVDGPTVAFHLCCQRLKSVPKTPNEKCTTHARHTGYATTDVAISFSLKGCLAWR